MSKDTYLRNAEEGEEDAAGACRSPDEEHLDLETSRAGRDVDEVRGSVADTEVPEPVRRAVSHTTSNTERWTKKTHQFDAVDMDMALARMLRGKISPVMTQAMGPQVAAKLPM